jgi:hypothetical protein
VERREPMPIDASTFGEQLMSQRVRRDANGRQGRILENRAP